MNKPVTRDAATRELRRPGAPGETASAGGAEADRVARLIDEAARRGDASAPDALACAREACDAARATGRDDLIARAEHTLGSVCAATGDLAGGVHHLSSAAERSIGDPARRAESLRVLANVHGNLLGDLELGLVTLEHARAAADVAKSPTIRARVLGSQGTMLGRLGRHDEARVALEAALDALEAVDEPALIALQESNLGYLHVVCGRHAEAIAHLERAIALAARAGIRSESVNATGSLVIALAGAGRIAESDALASELVADLETGDDAYSRLQVPLDLARAKSIAGDAVRARELLESGLPPVAAAGLTALEVEYLEALDAAAETQGDLAAALAYRKRLLEAERRRFHGEIASRVATIEGVMRFDQQQRENRMLRDVRRDLEARVAERTAQLQSANDALRRSEQRFRDLTDLSSDWFWEQDAELRFVDFAHENLARRDFDARPLIGKRRWETGIEGVSDAAWEAHRAMLERREPFRDLLFRRRNLNGEMRWYTVSGKPVFDENGGFAGYRGIGHEVTARIELERRLVRRQRFEAMGELAGGIAHEFNNIVGIIAASVHLLRESRGADAESLERLDTAARRASSLVRQILAFAGGRMPERETIDVGAAVDDAVRFLRATLPARVSLNARADAGAHRAEASTVAIHQIVVNLVTNAAYAMSGQGVVEIDLERMPAGDPATAKFPALAGAPVVCLRVGDTGVGMTAETLARAFEPFFTTRPPGEGSGLGLAVVDTLVRDAGGAIDVESVPGRGTSVRVLLPAREVPAAPAASPSPDAGASPGRGGRVLYVDDDEALVFLVRRLLERQGYRVDAHQDPLAALDALARDPGGYDALVTDLAMPSLSGFDVAERARAIRADLPIVVMSGYVREVDAERARELGIGDICVKPSLVDALVRTLDRRLGNGGAAAPS